MSQRDTQFVGFAKALWDELPDLNTNSLIAFDDWSATCEKIIAQHAYDLVKHTLNMVPHLLAIAEQAKTVEEVIVHVPDLTKLPEVSR